MRANKEKVAAKKALKVLPEQPDLLHASTCPQDAFTASELFVLLVALQQQMVPAAVSSKQRRAPSTRCRL